MSKKILVFLLAIAMLASCAGLTACHKKEEVKTPTEAAIRYDSLEEIEVMLGYSITVPKDINVEAYTIRKKTSIQVVFDGGYIRKAKSDKAVSGAPEGAKKETLVVGENEVTMYTQDDAVLLATWRVGEFSYCIGFQTGCKKDTVASYISQIK